ncbi:MULTISPECIES: LysR substrate-binding domain-containing protein [Filomicrobium]|uniref:Transcriptional regulator, LysR family n=1 Tax=Filomicrobium insigne TaxID=418854 RepID=A0A1H0SB33_9HYPH|nr:MULTISPECIES: LysR substrate-binding domain-containing protein [Filomicrobium]MCV0371156.1 LysR family transcriptional regulator [Filomicrobium sp.]SDP38448.1 transcriptional regulator, LysR family [Filomicrobium insigne]
MQDLNDLYYFVQVVDHSGYASAARALGIPRSKLSRRIMELEQRLGVRLLQRSTRKLTVTEIGQEYYRHCVAMLVEAEAAQEAIERSRSGPQGLIRVSAPPALVCFEVGPMIARYMAANPRVAIELESTSRRVDVIGEGIDIALRVRFPPLEPSDLVMRNLGESPQRIVASPELMRGFSLPLVPTDLSAQPSLDLGPMLPKHVWELHGADGASVRVTHKPRLVTDDMAQLLHAALEGVGVVKLPTMVVDTHIASDKLVDVMPGWMPRGGIVHAVFPSRRGLLPSVRSFIDFLAAEYERVCKAQQKNS